MAAVPAQSRAPDGYVACAVRPQPGTLPGLRNASILRGSDVRLPRHNQGPGDPPVLPAPALPATVAARRHRSTGVATDAHRKYQIACAMSFHPVQGPGLSM